MKSDTVGWSLIDRFSFSEESVFSDLPVILPRQSVSLVTMHRGEESVYGVGLTSMQTEAGKHLSCVTLLPPGELWISMALACVKGSGGTVYTPALTDEITAKQKHQREKVERKMRKAEKKAARQIEKNIINEKKAARKIKKDKKNGIYVENQSIQDLTNDNDNDNGSENDNDNKNDNENEEEPIDLTDCDIIKDFIENAIPLMVYDKRLVNALNYMFKSWIVKDEGDK